MCESNGSAALFAKNAEIAKSAAPLWQPAQKIELLRLDELVSP